MDGHRANSERAARIWQAQGVVSVQAGCSLDDAMWKILDRARIRHENIWQIAVAVMDHRIRFDQ